MSNRIIVDVRGGAIRNNYLRMAEADISFFPSDVCCATGERPKRTFALFLDGSHERLKTYILTDKRHFYDRTLAWERFFAANEMYDTGEKSVLYKVAVEEVEPYSYRIYRVS